MLPKKHRLTADYDFRKIRRQGKSIQTPFFNLNYLSKEDDSPPRFGFVVSTKLDKRAAKRNKIKRVFREVVQTILPRARGGFDSVFWIKRKALDTDSAKIRGAVESTMRKGNLLSSV